MRRALLIAVLASAAFAQQPAPATPVAPPLSPDQLLGTWVAVHRSLGGLGSIWEFMPGGMLRLSFGAIVEEPYRVEGNRLILPPGSTLPNAKPLVTTIRFEGDYMFQSSPDTSRHLEARFKRASPANPGDPPIVGVWEMDTPASEPDAMPNADGASPEAKQRSAAMTELAHNTFHQYTRDGLAKIRVPMRSISGSYNLAAQTFSLISGSSDAHVALKTGSFQLRDGLLVLTQPDGKSEDTYIRADATVDELKRAGVSYGGKPADFSPARLEIPAH